MSDTGSYTTTTDNTNTPPRTQGGEGAFVAAPDDDPFKGAFTAATDDDNAPSDFDGSFVVGEPDENEDEEQKQKRDKALKDYNDEKEKEKNKDKNGNNKGIRDHDDDWFSISHHGPKDQQQNVRHMTMDQLRELIMKAVLEKGWNEIWIYNASTKEINQKLTGQAEKMLGEMLGEGGILHGVVQAPPKIHNTRMSAQKDPETGKIKVEPWEKGLFQGVHELDMNIRNWRNGRLQKKAARKTDAAHRKLAKKKGFGDKIGKDPEEIAREKKQAERAARKEAKKEAGRSARTGHQAGNGDESDRQRRLKDQFDESQNQGDTPTPQQAASDNNRGEAVDETAGETTGNTEKTAPKAPKM